MVAKIKRDAGSEPKPAGKKRDPERTRLVIIEAAREEFAENGYDGARTDRIRQQARFRKNLVEIFGDRQRLPDFQAIVVQARR